MEQEVEQEVKQEEVNQRRIWAIQAVLPVDLVKVMVDAKVTPSFNEAKRLLKQGAVDLGKVKSIPRFCFVADGELLRVGKLCFLVLRLPPPDCFDDILIDVSNAMGDKVHEDIPVVGTQSTEERAKRSLEFSSRAQEFIIQLTDAEIERNEKCLWETRGS